MSSGSFKAGGNAAAPGPGTASGGRGFESTGLLARWFWTYFHRTDSSASFRWALAISAVVCLMPVFGSALSVLMIGSGIVAFVYRVLDRENLKESKRERLIYIIFLLYIIITVAFSIIHKNTLEGMRVIFNNTGFVLCIPLLAVLRYYYRPYWRNWLQNAFAFAGVLCGAVVLMQVIVLDRARPEAFDGNPLVLSYLSGTTALFCLSFLVAREPSRRLLTALGLAGSIVALLLSSGRGPLIFFTVAAIGLLFANARFNSFKVIALSLYWSFVASIVAFSVLDETPAVKTLMMRVDDTVEDLTRLMNWESSDPNMRIRLEMYESGSKAFLNAPLLGYGRQNVGRAAQSYQGAGSVYDISGTKHLHNAFLTEGVSSGIAGIISIILVLFTPIIAVWGKVRRVLSTQAWGFSLFTFLCFQTNIGFYHDIMTFYFCAIVLYLNFSPPSTAEPQHWSDEHARAFQKYALQRQKMEPAG